jgi:hypothetical protein
MSGPSQYDDANDPFLYAPRSARAAAAIDQAGFEQRWVPPARRLKSPQPAGNPEDRYQARVEVREAAPQGSHASWASLEPERVAPPPDNPNSTTAIFVRFVVVTVAIAAVIALIIVVANAVFQGQYSATQRTAAQKVLAPPEAPLSTQPAPTVARIETVQSVQAAQVQMTQGSATEQKRTAAQMALAAPEAPLSTQPAPTAARIEAVQSVQAVQEQMTVEQKRAIEQRQTADRLVHAAPSLPSRTSPPSPPSAGGEQLLARADALIGQGDIMGARLVLERAIEAGSARAAFALARTYDPLMLSSWNTYGIRGDLARARDLYARAYAGGIAEAKERMEALK